MDRDAYLSFKRDMVDIEGLEALILFTRYRAHDQRFVEGLELAEDLQTKAGVILYTKNTVITPTVISRLIKVQITLPKLIFTFKIKRNAKLIQKFRTEIGKIIEVILYRRMKTKLYRGLLFDLKEQIQDVFNLFLSDDEMTVAVYKMLFMIECSSIKRSILFFNHPINVAIYSVAMALSPRYESFVKKDDELQKERLVDVIKTGMFHNYGAITQIDKILKAQEEKRYEQYLEANKNGYYLLSKIQLGFEVMDAIRLLHEYYMGRIGFLDKEDWTSVMTNIVLVAEIFSRKESGLFSAPFEAKDIVDQMNVSMMDKKLNKRAVQVLTLGLNLQDIFDFYEEIEYLVKECIHKNSGFPYPLEGFKSPTLFICRDNINDCQYLEGSLKAVTIVKPLGSLKPGRYHRCWLLTPKLLLFYSSHYKEIKKASLEEEKPEKK